MISRSRSRIDMKKSFTIAAITLGFLLPLAAIAAVDPAPANVLTTPDYCPSLMRNLFRGRQGSDVQALQRYLIFQQLLPSDSSTGFFGPATESAVRNWQKAQGIVSLGDAVSTGWGVVGARTRAAIAVQCKNVLAPTLRCPTAPSTPSCPIGRLRPRYARRGGRRTRTRTVAPLHTDVLFLSLVSLVSLAPRYRRRRIFSERSLPPARPRSRSRSERTFKIRLLMQGVCTK